MQPPTKKARSDSEKATTFVQKGPSTPTSSEEAQRSNQRLRIVTWNVASYRAASGALLKYIQKTDPDIVCLQETKLQSSATPGPFLLPQYRSKTWFCSTARKGYSGTAVLSKWQPERIHRGIPGHPEHDAEGRCIVYEFPDFVLINVYVPNAGLAACERLSYRVEHWDCALRDYLKRLSAEGRWVILCGDMNVAMEDRDVYAVEACQGHAGFTRAERESFRETLRQAGLVDAFLVLHGDKAEPRFTFWDYRDSVGGVRRNGWRIDLFCVSAEMVERKAKETVAELDNCSEQDLLPTQAGRMTATSVWKVVEVRPRADVYGSDHCPVEMELVRRPNSMEQAPMAAQLASEQQESTVSPKETSPSDEADALKRSASGEADAGDAARRAATPDPC
ncbi:hypothetical protein CCYA_CCYA18G4506 [Cyanidiococcus yangmingshanensis]|nr:hypothetical protein CCYA_CCYA18G4506 [Cyanidiococcus yangmingshanensis]